MGDSGVTQKIAAAYTRCILRPEICTVCQPLLSVALARPEILGIDLSLERCDLIFGIERHLKVIVDRRK